MQWRSLPAALVVNPDLGVFDSTFDLGGIQESLRPFLKDSCLLGNNRELLDGQDGTEILASEVSIALDGDLMASR